MGESSTIVPGYHWVIMSDKEHPSMKLGHKQDLFLGRSFELKFYSYYYYS